MEYFLPDFDKILNNTTLQKLPVIELIFEACCAIFKKKIRVIMLVSYSIVIKEYFVGEINSYS